MTRELFEQWVNIHITATGAEPVRLAELLWANRDTIIERWHAEYAELCECSERLIERRRVPEFANEHTNAIHRELTALREEQARKKRVDSFRAVHGGHVQGCDCPHCNGGEILPSYEAAMDRFRNRERQKTKGF